jgi:transaldolase
MNRPEGLKTKIFLDSGSSEDTQKALDMLGFLDGQTTNPTYFVKTNREVKAAVEAGKKFSKAELLETYKQLAQEISPLVPADGSVSIEVYADENTTAEEMIEQGREMFTWIPNAHIKLPIIPAGLKAAEVLVGEGKRVNMTLCFDQEQGAAVHAATRGATKGQVFLSPFVSRLDKIGQNGFDLLLNIQKMLRENNSNVQILSASVHSVYDIAHIIEAEMDLITIPAGDMPAWVEAGTPFTTEGLEKKDTSGLVPIEYKELDLSADYTSFNIQHELTDKGLATFAADWNSILE